MNVMQLAIQVACAFRFVPIDENSDIRKCSVIQSLYDYLISF
jgi:hypothetical protein